MVGGGGGKCVTEMLTTNSSTCDVTDYFYSKTVKNFKNCTFDLYADFDEW